MPGESINHVQYAAPTTPVTVYRVTADGPGRAIDIVHHHLQSIFR